MFIIFLAFFFIDIIYLYVYRENAATDWTVLIFQFWLPMPGRLISLEKKKSI